jgi:hypothetical protein
MGADLSKHVAKHFILREFLLLDSWKLEAEDPQSIKQYRTIPVSQKLVAAPPWATRKPLPDPFVDRPALPSGRCAASETAVDHKECTLYLAEISSYILTRSPVYSWHPRRL